MIRIDPTAGTAIYEQIINQYKEAILKGYLKEGDLIPSVRKLAMELSITPNTVAKAYSELERQKIIVTVRGKGTFISSRPKERPSRERQEAVEEALKNQIVALKMMDFSRSEILEMAGRIYDELEGEDSE